MKKRTKKKAVKNQKKLSLQLGENIWPAERDILFRPDRLKYVRKLIKDQGCVFCAAGDKGPSFETLCVYQTKYSMIVMNKFPYNSGHILVLPQRHCGDLLELNQAEYTDLMDLVRVAMKALMTVYEPGGINMGLNHGAVAGAGIPDHLHFHMIPRWSGDLNFFPLVAETKVVIESLETTFDRLVDYFKTIKGK